MLIFSLYNLIINQTKSLSILKLIIQESIINTSLEHHIQAGLDAYIQDDCSFEITTAFVLHDDDNNRLVVWSCNDVLVVEYLN